MFISSYIQYILNKKKGIKQVLHISHNSDCSKIGWPQSRNWWIIFISLFWIVTVNTQSDKEIKSMNEIFLYLKEGFNFPKIF